MKMDVDVGGGGAIGGFIIGSFSFEIVSLTFAANVWETTVVVVTVEVEMADLGDALPVDIIIALVYDIVVLVLDLDNGVDEFAVTVVIITWFAFLSTRKQ